MELRIGELARTARTTAPTVRYYEQVGLLPPPDRKGTQRRYTEDDVRRLMFVRRCRDLGFSLAQTRLLVTLSREAGRPCMEARDVAQEHLASVRNRLRELHELERRIADVIEAADATCTGGSVADCPVLDEMSRDTGPFAEIDASAANLERHAR